MPLNLILILFTLGLGLTIFSKKSGRSLIILSFVLLVGLGIFPIGKNTLVFLENIHERPQTLPERIDGILVLGGSLDTSISESRGTISFNDSAERLFAALSIAKDYPNAILVFSGGNGYLQGGERVEVDDTKVFLAAFDYPEDNVIYEGGSRNTFENIKFSKELIIPQLGENWLLVTSAYHMPRAHAVARRQNWFDITAYPVDYRTSGKISWLPQKFDLLGNLYAAQLAWREIIGLTAYQLTGKISLSL